MSLKQFLLDALESGEHAVQVVGVGGITAIVLDHNSFLTKLVEAIEAFESASHVPATNAEAQAIAHASALANTPAVGIPAMNPVPTPEQIAEYLRTHPLAGMSLTDPEVGMGDSASNVTGVQSVPVAAGDPHPITGAPLTAEQAAAIAALAQPGSGAQ